MMEKAVSIPSRTVYCTTLSTIPVYYMYHKLQCNYLRKFLLMADWTPISSGQDSYELPFCFTELDPNHEKRTKLELELGSEFKVLCENVVIDSEMNTDSAWVVGRYLITITDGNDEITESGKYHWLDESSLSSGPLVFTCFAILLLDYSL